jgi:hypothetical protein
MASELTINDNEPSANKGAIDRTYVYLGIEIFGEKLVEGILEPIDSGDQEPRYCIEEFDETNEYVLVNYIPPSGTALFYAFQRQMQGTPGIIALSLFQRRGKNSLEGKSPGLRLCSCALLTRPTGWMVLGNPPETLARQLGLDWDNAEPAFVRIFPPQIKQRFFESTFEFKNGATMPLSQLAQSWNTNAFYHPLTVRPLDARSRLVEQGYAAIRDVANPIGKVFGAPASSPENNLPQVKPFPAPAQPVLPAREAQRVKLPGQFEYRQDQAGDGQGLQISGPTPSESGERIVQFVPK